MTGLDWIVLLSILVVLVCWAAREMAATRPPAPRRPPKPTDEPSGPPDSHFLDRT